MKITRKLMAVAIAAGLAAGSTIAWAAPPAGFGPGNGPCAFGGGPGMMGGGWGGGPMGPGMGYGPRGGGYGPGAAAGLGPRGGFGPGAGAGPVANQEARLAFLKQELKITADQETAWNAYAAQAKAHAATMETFRAQPPVTAQSADERIAQRAEIARLRAEQVKAQSAAVKDLYAVLTPEQKAVADQHFGGPRVARGGGYGRWR
jgi:Spy/CpxP family protein refolding chaperone